jgi:2-(1,2-epoxy-1,2-dihydrophenyl)acetyl-CoA isomerase
MTDYTGIRYSVADGVARITLARPEVSNSVDLPTAQSIGAAVQVAGADDSVRAVLVDADGARFCAGGDVASMAASPDQAAYLLDLANAFDGALQRLAALEKPVVAAVQGAAAGAGLATVLAADVVVAARGTKFLTAYAGIGLTPDCGLSYLLPRAVGQQRALELALTGRVLSADDALAWGLVTEVVEPDELSVRADAVAAKLAQGSVFALGQARRLIRTSWAQTRAESGADEAVTISRAVKTPESQALIKAFVGG